jgi:hypothetical protein
VISFSAITIRAALGELRREKDDERLVHCVGERASGVPPSLARRKM